MKILSKILFYISIVSCISLLSFGIYGAFLGIGYKVPIDSCTNEFKNYMISILEVDILQYFLIMCIIYLIGYLLHGICVLLKNKSSFTTKKIENSKAILMFTFFIYNVLFGIGVLASIVRREKAYRTIFWWSWSGDGI